MREDAEQVPRLRKWDVLRVFQTPPTLPSTRAYSPATLTVHGLPAVAPRLSAAQPPIRSPRGTSETHPKENKLMGECHTSTLGPAASAPKPNK